MAAPHNRARAAPVLYGPAALNLSGLIAANAVGGEFASIADTTSLSMGVNVMSMAVWVKPKQVLAGQQFLLTKAQGSSAADTEYGLYLSSNQFNAQVSDGTTLFTVTATNFGNVRDGVWHLVVATLNGSTLAISVNAGTANTTAAVVTVADSTNTFKLGARNNGAFAFGGQIGPAGVWRSKALTTTEIAELYNGGKPLCYYQLSAGLRTNLQGYWDMCDATINDDTGNGNNLALTNGAHFARGM